ncbi:MAG: hypothetical protein AB8H12_08640 [Lewinella sp.]
MTNFLLTASSQLVVTSPEKITPLLVQNIVVCVVILGLLAFFGRSPKGLNRPGTE